jgi:hypothetical protein
VTNSSHTHSHRLRHPTGSRRWGSTAPDHVEAFPNDVSKLSVATDSYRLAIHDNLEFGGTVLAADPAYYVRVIQFKGPRSVGDLRSPGHSAALGAEAAHGLVSGQSASAFPNSPARFRGKVIILDFDHSLGDSTTLGAEAADGLASDQSTSVTISEPVLNDCVVRSTMVPWCPPQRLA